MAANNLRGRKLSKRQKLIIPYPGEVITPAEEVKEDTLRVEPSVEIAEIAGQQDSIVNVQPKEKIKTIISFSKYPQ